MTPAAAIVLGFVLILLGIPMIRAWVPRAGFDWMPMAGLTLSDKAWYESHRRSGWDFVMIGAILIALAMWIGAPGWRGSVRDFLGVSVVVALVIAGIRSLVFTLRLSQERDTVL